MAESLSEYINHFHALKAKLFIPSWLGFGTLGIRALG
jgi:hypothetical protein